MPSSEKTSLGLNNWKAQDKPAREDFCGDHTLLDTLLSGHFSDQSLHLTNEERKYLAGSAAGTYEGDGEAEQQILLPFVPKIVIIAQSSAAPISLSGAVTEIHAGLAAPSNGTAGVSLSGQTLSIAQSQSEPPAGGQKICLNQAGSVYFWAALR